MNSIQDMWEEVLKLLSSTLSPVAINTWFTDCSPIEINGSTLYVRTPNDFKKGILDTRFKSNVENCLTELFGAPFEVEFLTEEGYATYQETRKETTTLPEMIGYTFDRFIVGKSNEFAHASARAVAENPGKIYNPLFIYGESGLGKSHLLFSIGQYIREKNPKTNIVYVKGDDFINEMVLSIREGKMLDFHNKYRNAELFLVDDIQFIAGKQQTQDEFFHCFNSIFEAGHQIVITSDRPPHEMKLLEDRLRTRFSGGLVADIQRPDFETRVAIARNKASRLGLLLKNEHYEYIGNHVTSNIRQLEGVINRLTAMSNIMNQEITLEDVKKAIEQTAHEGIYIPTPDRIIKETARFFSLKPEDIRGQSRSKTTALARQIAMYLIRSLTNLTLEEIGAEFGDRNHTTVLASIRKIEEMLPTDEKLTNTIRDLTSNINTV